MRADQRVIACLQILRHQIIHGGKSITRAERLQRPLVTLIVELSLRVDVMADGIGKT